jgi:hypothetical protein
MFNMSVSIIPNKVKGMRKMEVAYIQAGRALWGEGALTNCARFLLHALVRQW